MSIFSVAAPMAPACSDAPVPACPLSLPDWEAGDRLGSLPFLSRDFAAMWIYAGLWLLLGAYAAGVVGPRMVWVLAGRRCPRCESGRLWFGGLAENPWRRLRSWWRCESCRAEVRELAWGRLEVRANRAESGAEVAAIDADMAA